MELSDFVIDHEDFKFFQGLPNTEKILFMYDLICEEYYDKGSVSFEPAASSEFDLRALVDKIVHPSNNASVIILGSMLVINSEIRDYYYDAVENLFLNGYLIVGRIMTDKQRYIFQRQKYCGMYEIIGVVDPINLN
jgi:hypothetical protein